MSFHRLMEGLWTCPENELGRIAEMHVRGVFASEPAVLSPTDRMIDVINGVDAMAQYARVAAHAPNGSRAPRSVAAVPAVSPSWPGFVRSRSITMRRDKKWQRRSSRTGSFCSGS